MTVEDRVRRALHADAARLEVPTRPSLAELEQRTQRRPWRWVVAAGAAAAALALVALVAVMVGLLPRPEVEIGPADDPEAMPAHDLLVDPETDEIVAEGTVAEVRWLVAARAGELMCLGVRIDSEELSDGRTSCSRAAASRGEVAHIGATEQGVVAIAGWVGEDVARAVWELPDGDMELELEQRPGLAIRVFGAAGQPGDEITIVRFYDHDGRSLGGVGVAGARHEMDGD